MKKALLTLSAVVLIICSLVLVSCANDNNTPAGTTSGTTAATTAVTTTNSPDSNLLNASDFVVIRPQSLDSDLALAVKNLRNELNSRLDLSLKIANDLIKKDDTSYITAKEILVGETNRAESAAAMEALTADANATYRIGYDGLKITIVAKDNESFVYAISEFLRLYASSEEKGMLNITDSFSVMGKYSSSVDILENFAAVEILSTSTIQDTKRGRYWPTYGRILQLKHNGENNGTLYATSQWSQKSFPVYKSTDDGKTWSLIAQVSEQLDKTLTANWQPHIFELPCQVGEMPEGTLLLAGCAYKPGVTDTYMCIWRSYDLGKTWEEFTVVDQGGGTDIDDGMYEPFLICDEDGSLVCFYSDETEVWQNGGQRLVFRVSKDGVNWGEKKYCVAPKNTKLRPGMVSVAKMGDNGYILTYEMIGQDGGPTYVKTSDSLTDWGDGSELGHRVATDLGDVTGCTPYIEWTPAGGEYGTVICAGRFGGNKNIGHVMSKLFLSFDLGKNWYAFENPLEYNYDFDNWTTPNFAYSFGFFVGSDGSIYYINNVEPAIEADKQLCSDLKMAKIKIYAPGEYVAKN